MQFEHVDWPVDGLNVPDEHAVQLAEEELAWKYPSLQFTHVAIETAAIDEEYVPVVQPRQVATEVAPTVVEYVPAPHD